MQHAAGRRQRAQEVRTREAVDQREGGAVGETGHGDALRIQAEALAPPAEGLEDAALLDLSPGVVDRLRRDQDVAAALRLAQPGPDEVAAVPRAALQRDDHRPGALGVVALGRV